ncbi:MAG TPA: VWA domain-containing protein [Ignavibacteriaceae bacterium]
MFRFAHPEYLNALYAIPVLVAIFWYLYRKSRKNLELFADKKLHRVLLPDFSGIKNWIKAGLVLFALVLLIFAAANPQVGTRVQEVKQTGIDVFIALDVSRSMLAQDIKPDRLDQAKFQISSLINKLRGDRIGLVIFAGEAFVQFPLTTDYSAANLFLSAVDVNSVPQQGTAIASAIDLSVKSFDYKTSTQKVIVIITDGEDHEGDITPAVEAAREKGIKIYTIGLGSTTGVPIPVFNAQGQQVDYKKDEDGNIVLTKLDDETLRKIASAGDGKYFQASTYDDYLDRIYSDLSSLEKSEFGVRKVTDYEDRFYYFLAPAIIFLLVEFFMSDRRSVLFDKLNRKLGIEEKV